MGEIIELALFLLVLLNPFLVIVYLLDALQTLSKKRFRQVLFRAGIVSFIVFCMFALLGDAIFSSIIQANFASFQIFGGIVFLIIGMQFMFKGGVAIEGLRGESKHLVGAVAMPILIGPGTLSYSVVIGKRLFPVEAILSIFIAVFVSVSVIVLLKWLHDFIHERNEEIVQRYFDIAGRIMSLLVGTISVEMIMLGLQEWIPLLTQ